MSNILVRPLLSSDSKARTLSITEVKKDFSRLMDEIECGQPLVVTKHGKPMARLEVIDGDPEQEWPKIKAAHPRQST